MDGEYCPKPAGGEPESVGSRSQRLRPYARIATIRVGYQPTIEGRIVSELVLPSPNEVTVANVAALIVRSAEIRALIQEQGDVNAARELHRQLAALSRYVGDKRVRAALEGEQRLAEVLIGLLLGPSPGPGRPLEQSSIVEDIGAVSTADRSRFRKLAERPERVEQLVRDGVTQRSQILRRLDHDERAHDPPPLVTLGEYPVLLADPPWRYQFAETKSRAIENQYPTMPLDAICALEPPAANDAVLYLWATSPKLQEALKVLKAWRFDYRTNLVWVKDRVGMGYWAAAASRTLASRRPRHLRSAPRRATTRFGY